MIWRAPWLKGFPFRFRNAGAAQGGPRVLKEFRRILDYDLPLL